MEVNVLGAGIGGLSVAALLANNGFKVNVIEQNERPGGKAGQIKVDGYVFDTGPSLLTLPNWIDDLFLECSKDPRDYYNYQKLDLVTRYFFEDNSFVDVVADLEDTAENFNKHSGFSKIKFLNYFNLWKKIYKISEKTFLKGQLVYDLSFFKNAVVWLSKTGLSNIFRSMASYNSKNINNKYIEQIMNRFATYTGSSPYKTPAFMNQLAVVEMVNGAYFPKDGIYSIPSALHQLCKDLGVNFFYNEKIISIDLNKENITVKTQNNIFKSQLSISNVDFHVTQKLLGRKNTITFKELSTSAIVFYWGIKGEFKELKLHNIIFSADYQKEFDEIFNQSSIPSDPTIYINISSKLEKSHAPNGCENWFVMVNIPPQPDLVTASEIQRVKNLIIKQIDHRYNIYLDKLIEFEDILTPQGLYEKTGSFNGALYGQHQNSLSTIMKRKSNEDDLIKNFFYVGGSVHPGGGIPLALRSGMNTAKQIINDYNKVSKV
jgi:phytoene desaturase